MAIAASWRSQSLSMASRERPRTNSSPSPAQGGVHGFRPARDEVQRADRFEQTSDAPGRHLADAVAGDDGAWHDVPRARRGGQRLQRAENLAGPVAMQSLALFAPHEIARIAATQQRRRMCKQVRRFGRVAGQGEHVRMLPPCPEQRIARVMIAAQCGKSTAMAIAMVTMLRYGAAR